MAFIPDPFDSPLLPMDATHMDEIQYVFGTVGAAGGSEAQVALSEEMIGYWTRFAKRGAPDCSSDWSPFTSGDISSTVKKLDTPSANVTAMDFAIAHNCAYWGNPPIAVK